MWNPHYVQIASYYINLTGTDPSFLTHAAIEPSHEPNVLDFSVYRKPVSCGTKRLVLTANRCLHAPLTGLAHLNARLSSDACRRPAESQEWWAMPAETLVSPLHSAGLRFLLCPALYCPLHPSQWSHLKRIHVLCCSFVSTATCAVRTQKVEHTVRYSSCSSADVNWHSANARHWTEEELSYSVQRTY